MVSNFKIADLVSALNEEERLGFRSFLLSPYFLDGGVREELYLLWEVIDEQIALKKEIDSLNKEETYNRIFPGRPFIEKKLEKLLSVLHQTLRRYIIVLQIEKKQNQFEASLLLLDFFRERGLTNRFENLKEKLRSELENELLNDPKSINRRFLLEYEILLYENLFNAKKSYQNIPLTLESLEQSYLLNKLELLNQYLLNQKITLFSLPDDIADSIANSYFPESIIIKNPMVLVSYRIFQLLGQEKPIVEDFQNLQALFKEHESEFSDEFAKLFFSYLRNFCSLLVNSNQSQFLPVLFNLAKENYERGYLHYQGKISSFSLASITNTALQTGQIDWCASFIAENEGKIFNDTPEHDYLRLCKANLYFAQGQYESALEVLPASINRIDFHLLARRIEIKCYYEMQSELLDYKLDAYKMYLSRASKTVLQASPRERNANFVYLLVKISDARISRDKKRAQSLVKRIEEKDLLAEREWLLEKIKEIQ